MRIGQWPVDRHPQPVGQPVAQLLTLLGLLVFRGLPIAKGVKPGTFGLLTRVCLLGIVFCSVMAFN